MYIDDFYTPSTQFGFEPDSSGYIPDQNQTVYYSPRDLQFQNQVDSDAMQQLGNFIAQQQPSTKKQSGYIAINKGDTLSKLAQQYGTTVEDLAKLNGIRDINKIKAGGILRLTNDVKNKYTEPVYTKHTPRSTKTVSYRQNKSLNKPTSTQQKSNTAVVTANVNSQKTLSDRFSYKPQITQYVLKSNKNYQNNIRKKNQKHATTQVSKPRSLFDVILNISRSINDENRRERQRLEEYDRKHPRQNR